MKKKYLMIYHDGNGNIKKGDVKVEEWSKYELEDTQTFVDADLLCMIPLNYIDKKAILKHLKNGH